MTDPASGPRIEPTGTPECWPRVSLVVPCLNEVGHIDDVLFDLLNQDYPGGDLEVLVVDGMSDDGTRDVVRRWSERDHRVRLVDNPDVNKPAALNRGIRASSGSVVVRIDAHASYPREYVRLCVHNLLETDADNVGGIRRTEPQDDTPLGRAIALSISSWFGSGGATYRTGASTRKWVDTVFCGTYRRETFNEFGMFDERLLRGQDREFNERLRRAGRRILFVPEIQVVYYARSSLSAFSRWVFDGGATPFLVSRLTGFRVWSWRNLAPPLFVLFLLGLPGMAALVASPLWTAWVLGVGLYLAMGLAFAVRDTVAAGRPTLVFHVWFVLTLTHLLYGVGALVGMVRSTASQERVAS